MAWTSSIGGGSPAVITALTSVLARALEVTDASAQFARKVQADEGSSASRELALGLRLRLWRAGDGRKDRRSRHIEQ